MVRPAKRCIGAELTTPSARKKVASRLLIDRAATPPLRGGECCSHRRYNVIRYTATGSLNPFTWSGASFCAATRPFKR